MHLQGSIESDSEDDESMWSNRLRTVKHLRDVAKKVIRVNTSKEGRAYLSMLLESGLQKLDRRRNKEHEEHHLFLSQILGNAALMAKTTHALRSVSDLLFTKNGFDRTTLFSAIVRALHQLKVYVANTCWDQAVIRCKEELSEQRVKCESMKRILQDSRESYLKDVAALRDQVRMRSQLDDEIPSMDIVSYFDPEYTMSPEEQKFLFDAVREKVKMMIEHNPNVENCIDFGQLERLQNRVENNALQDTKKALKNTLARLNEAEGIIAGMRKAMPDNVLPEPAEATEKNSEVLEDQISDLHDKLSIEKNALIVAKKNILGLEGERDDLSQSLRNMATEQVMHKMELNRLQDRLTHYESITCDDKREISKLQEVVQAQEGEIKQLKVSASREKRSSQRSKEEEADFLDEALPCFAPCFADVTEATHQQMIDDFAADSDELTRIQSERDAALARCNILSDKFDKLSELVRCQVEQFLEWKSETILDNADAFMEQAEILGCVNVESTAEGARICGCGNILVHGTRLCKKCGTKWQKATTIAREACVGEDTLVSLTVELKDTKRNLDVAMAELREVLESQEERDDDDVSKDVEWFEKLMRVQADVDTQRCKKMRLEALLLEARVRAANRASLEMPIAENHCACKCAEELRATRKLLERTKNLCTESTVSLQRAAFQNSVVNDTLNKMRGTLSKAVDVVQKVAGDNPDVRALLKTIEEARVQSIFNRLYNNSDATYRNERREKRKRKLLEGSIQAIYQLEPCSPAEDDNVHEYIKTTPRPSLICRSLLVTTPPTKRLGSRPPSARIRTNENVLVISSVPSSSHGSASSSRASSRVASPDPSRLPPIRVQTLNIIGHSSEHCHASLPPRPSPHTTRPHRNRSSA